MRSFEQSPGFRRFDEEPETPPYVAEPVAAPVAPAAPASGRVPRGPSGNSGMTPEIARAIAFGAEKFGIDEAVLVGMGAIESRNYDPAVISGKVLSPRGAAGMMQFMPDTAKRFGIDPTDPAQSAIGAAAYMRAHLDMFGGDYDKAMAAYNWGEDNVQKAVKKWGDKWLEHAPEETQNYVAYVNQMRGQAAPQDPAKMELPEGVKPSEAGGGRGMMVEEPGARAASLESASSDKSLINAQLDQPFTPISGTRAGLRGAAKPTPKSVMEGVGQEPVNQIERRGAPVTAETAQAARQALANATPAERALAARQPGWIGAVARAQNSQLAADDRSPEQIRRGIGTRQAREELYRSEGLDPQAAQERVTSDIAAGRAAAPLPSANLTQEQDRAVQTAIETGQEMRGSGFASRVGARTGLALGKGALGVAQFVADVTGQDDVSSNISKSRTVLDARENAIPDAGGVVGQAEKALSSVLMQLPHIALGAAGGGLAPILAQAAIQQFGDSYTEGKKRGLGVTESATRAGLMAAAEVVFERFGMGEKFQAFRNIASGSKNPIEKTFALYLDSQKKEIPAEMATTLSQFMVDKAPGIGTNQRAGTEELLSQLGDTIAQTMLGGGATFGAAHAAGAAVRAIVPDQPPTPRSLFSKDSLRADFENMAKRRGETFGSDATREAGLPDLVVPKGPAPTQVEDKPTVSARLPKMPGQEEADPAQRLAELERKASGTEDKQVPGLDGKIITVPGEQGQYLTDAEKTELAGLRAQNASQPVSPANPQAPAADATGVDLASQAPLPTAPNVEPRGIEPSVTTPSGGVTDIVGRQTVQTGPALTTTPAQQAAPVEPGRSLTGTVKTDKTPAQQAALLKEAPIPGVSQPEVRTALPEVEPTSSRPALLDGSYTGDVLAAPEQPFANKSQANLFRDKNQLKGWEAAPIANGWVLRPTSLEPTIGELRHAGQAVTKLQGLQVGGAAPFAGATLADALPADTGRAFGVARVAVRSLGINLVPLNGLASDGLYVDNQPDSVFVAADSTKPILFVAGHEVYHALKRLGGSVVQDFEQAVSAYLKPEVVADRQAEEEAGALPGQQMQGRGREEVVADVTGAMWLDPKFWREVMLRSPDLFQKVSAAFMEAATKIRAALTRNPSPEAKQFVSDVDAVRKLVAQMTVDARKGAPVKAGDSRKVDSDKNGAIATPSQSENANSRNAVSANPGQPQNAQDDKKGAVAAPTQAAEDVPGDLTEDEQAIAQAELEASMADGQWPGPAATGEIGPNGEVYFSGRKIDPIPTKIQLSKDELALSDLEILYGKGASGEKKSVREAAQLLQDRAIAALEKLGVAPGDLTDPKLQALASKIIAAEIEVALRKPGNAADWYSNKLVGTMAVASLIHPELRSDAKSRVAFLIALAVTSQNMAVPVNLSHSEGQYAAWKSTGEFPIRGWGTGAKAMRTNFARANALMKEYPAERLERFLNSTFTVGELSAVGWEVSGENVDTIVYGSAVFGPKIGNGFYQNISGNFTPLTMDMWFMRGIGRITGNLISGSQEEFGRLKEKFLGTATDIDFSGLEPSADFAEEHGIDEFTEENIKDDDVATELAKRVDSWFDKEFKKYRDQYDSGERTKPAIVNAAQRLIEQGGTNDVPVSGAHRNNLRKIFSGALKLLEDSGVPLTNADGQAIWWFPEKELYARLGAGNKKSAPTDYEREMIGIAKKRGFTDEQIKAEIGRARQRKRRSDKAGANGQGTGPVGGPSKQFTAAERSEFIRQRALDAYRGSAAAYGRGAGDGKSVRLIVAGKKIPVVAVWKPEKKPANRLNAVGIATPTVYEISPQDAGFFHGAISALKNGNKWAAAVHVYDQAEYGKMRLFLTQDAKAGFALKGDDVVSVFSTQKDGAAHSMLALAVQEGGRRLDAFDTVLPKIYALNGFVATSRTAWNDEYAPPGWSKALFASFNKGQPDVVYMAYSPAQSQLHTPESGKLMDYDAALAAQQAAVDNGGTNATQEPTILRSARASGSAEPPLRSGGGGSAGARSGGQDARGWSKRSPQPGSVTVEGWHYGKAKVPALSGVMYGSGIKGAEADRLAQSRDRRIKSRVYFYINRDDGTPPPKEDGLGPHKYEQRLANLYDPSTGDPRIPLIRNGMNEFESAILDAGYDGYIAPRFGMAVVMDATVPAKYIGEDRVGPVPITTPVSQRGKKSLMSREIFEVEPLVPQLQKIDPTLKMESGRVMYDSAAKDALNAEMERLGPSFRFSRRQTETPEFKKWFGKSKAIEMVGGSSSRNAVFAPMRMYHTSRADVQSFESGRKTVNSTTFGDVETTRAAIFFTPSVADSNAYGQLSDGRTAKGANTIPVYLKTENPLDLTEGVGEGVAEKLAATGHVTERFVYNSMPHWSMFDGEDGAAVVAAAKAAGYDSIIFNDENPITGDTFEAWAVFDPTQIKSAIGNNGQFNPEDPRINFSRRQAQTPDFKKWFGKSTIVNADGTPKVMYHGTARDIDAFRAKQAGAIFVTGSPRFAASFAGMSRNWLLDNYREVVSGSDIEAATLAAEMDIKADYGDRSQATKSLLGSLKSARPSGGALDYLRRRLEDFLPSDENIMPLYVKAENPFDYENPAHIKALDDHGLITPPRLREIEKGAWTEIEAGYIQDYLKVLGHDGFYVKEGGVKNLAVYSPTQLKSATGNRGTFDPDNPDLRMSRRPKPPPGGFSIPAPAGRFALDPESAYMRNRRIVQDRFVRLREVQKMIAEQGGLLNDSTDAYLAEERSHSRVAFAIDEFKDKWMRPFTEKAAKVGIDLDELSLYAYAKHAEERNKHIARINPSLPDGGSGMKTADAQAILANFQAQPNFQDIRDLHNDLMAVTQASRDLLWNEGLISDDEYTEWGNQYNDYIPLRGFEGVDPETGVRTGGRGINVRGKESMRALGRRSKAGNLIENVIADYERAVLRAEKNEIGRTFYRFVQANPDPKLWEVDPVKRTRKYDPAKHLVVSGLVEDVGPDTIAFKEDGKEVHIKIHDEALLRTMRASYMDETGQFQRVAAETLGVFNGYLRNTLTRWNPGFVVINTARDFQTANASVIDKLGFGALAKYNLHVVSAAAVSWRNERGTLIPGGGWDKWMTEFRAAGGATGGFFGRDVERIASDLRGMLIDAGATVQPKGSTATAKAIDRAVIALRGNRAAKVAAATAKLVESMGGMSENMFRVAAYRTAREMGKSPAQAASIAKNLTTNFDRRGEIGLFLNSAYLFFNASLQGAVRTLQYARNPKMTAVAAAGVALGLTAAMLGAGAGEEDGESYWDMIPDYVKERNLVIMLPPSEDKTLAGERIGKKGRYIKIPLAYGLNFLPVLGYGLADSFRHAQDPSKGRKSLTSAARVANAFLGSYNPLGGGVPKSVDEAWLMALPTVADIPYTLTQEIDSFGRKSAPERTRKEEPDSERAFMSDRGTAQHRIARWLNQATGGNQAQSGAIDITPATIEGAVRYATGGTGTFIMDVLSTAGQALGEEKVKSQNAPFLKALYGEVDSKAIIRDFYENRDEIEKSYAQLMAATKMGVPIPKSKQNDALYELGGYLQGIQKGLTELRKWEVDAVSREMSDDPEARKSGKADREKVEAEKAKLMRAFNKHYRKTWGAAE